MQYTGNDPDPFGNFNRVDQLGICSTEQGFLTRMTDKFCRIISFVQKGELLVKEESVQDTLHDLANYCALMSGYIESKKLYPAPTDERDLDIEIDKSENCPCDICRKPIYECDCPL